MIPPSNHDDDALWAERLGRDFSPLPDGGFAGRVLAALPSPKPARRSPGRLLFVFAGALAGLAVTVAADGAGPGPSADLGTTLTALAQALSPLADPTMLLALAVAGGSLLYAFSGSGLRRQ